MRELSYALSRLVLWGSFSFEKCIRNCFKRKRVILQDGEERTVPSVPGVRCFKPLDQCVKASKQSKEKQKQVSFDADKCNGRDLESFPPLTCPGCTAPQHLCFCSITSSRHLRSNSAPSSQHSIFKLGSRIFHFNSNVILSRLTRQCGVCACLMRQKSS